MKLAKESGDKGWQDIWCFGMQQDEQVMTQLHGMRAGGSMEMRLQSWEKGNPCWTHEQAHAQTSTGCQYRGLDALATISPSCYSQNTLLSPNYMCSPYTEYPLLCLFLLSLVFSFFSLFLLFCDCQRPND
jgi:hypothetical protein